MKNWLKIGVIGDYDPAKASHPPINESLRHAAARLSVQAQIDWLPTPSFLEPAALDLLNDYDCLWASSGSPFQSTQGMLNAIRQARESTLPFIAT